MFQFSWIYRGEYIESDRIGSDHSTGSLKNLSIFSFGQIDECQSVARAELAQFSTENSIITHVPLELKNVKIINKYNGPIGCHYST